METDPTHQPAATATEDETILHPVAPREVWRLLAPWFGYILLFAAGVLGLATASGGADPATYDAGIATFLLAALMIAIRLKRQLDGKYIGLLLAVDVHGEDSLLLSLAILAVLGLVGIFLAALVGGIFYGIGLALFIISAAFIFGEIKRYFDFRERGG